MSEGVLILLLAAALFLRTAMVVRKMHLLRSPTGFATTTGRAAKADGDNEPAGAEYRYQFSVGGQEIEVLSEWHGPTCLIHYRRTAPTDAVTVMSPNETFTVLGIGWLVVVVVVGLRVLG